MSQHTLLQRGPIRIHTYFLGLIYRSKKFNTFSHTVRATDLVERLPMETAKECHQRTLLY